MFHENWLSYIKDDAKINKIAIPGSHNAGTMQMPKTARCQNGSFYTQYLFGVREFGIRLKMDKNNVLRVAHGVTNGMTAENAFQNLRNIIIESNEFFIFDVRTYQTQKIGPLTLRYKGNADEVNRLVAKYLEPEKYALTRVDLSSLTVGEIRESGKRYILLNEDGEYDYSVNCELLGPWDPKIFGYRPKKFAETCVKYLKELTTEGFFWFQTQLTPNPGTENGIKWPSKLDELSRPFFSKIIARIASDPVSLAKANIIAGDFMTRDRMKVNEILYLNLIKDAVKDEFRDKYARAIGKRPRGTANGLLVV